MGLLKNIARIATDIVEVEAQVIPAVIASVLTGGAAGALLTGLTVGTRAILGKIDAESFAGDGLTLEELAAVNISRILQGLTPVNQFGIPLRGFVQVLIRNQLKDEVDKARAAASRPTTPGRSGLAPDRSASGRGSLEGRLVRFGRLVSFGRRRRALPTDVPVTPRQEIALARAADGTTALAPLELQERRSPSGQFSRPVRRVVLGGDSGFRLGRSGRCSGGRREFV